MSFDLGNYSITTPNSIRNTSSTVSFESGSFSLTTPNSIRNTSSTYTLEVSNGSYNHFSQKTLIEEEWLEYKATGIPFTVFMSLVILVGTSGNIYTLNVSWHYGKLKHYLIWLSSVDLMACSLGAAEFIVRQRKLYTYTSDHTCKFFNMLHLALGLVSIMLLNLIALDRYLRICTHWKISQRTGLIFCGILSVIAIGFSSFAWMYDSLPVKAPISGLKGYQCPIGNNLQGTHLQKAFFCSLAIIAIVFMALCVIPYVLVLRKLREHHKENTAAKTEDTVRRERIVKMFLVSSAFSYGSLVPFVVIHLVANFSSINVKENFGQWENVIMHIHSMNHVMNPIIYSVINKDFRKKAKKVIRKLSKKQNE